ncbi:MAG: hypothetical protein RI996_621 [Candidatus Parcubacteria bacterium]|jgi:hypothetical protein
MFKLIFNLLLIGAAVGLFFLPKYGISAKYEDIKSVQAQAKEYANANNSAKELAEKRDNLTNEYNQISDQEKKRLVTFLPDNIDPIRFILEMESVGRKIGMPIRGAKYSSVKNVTNAQDTIATEDTKYGIFTFEFTTEGSYDNMYTLLESLNNSLRLIDVTSVTVTPSGGATDAQRSADFFTYNVRLNAYWLK